MLDLTLALFTEENKLIKQAFSIAKLGLKYDMNFDLIKPSYSLLYLDFTTVHCYGYLLSSLLF